MWGDDRGATYKVTYQPYEHYLEPPPQGLKFSDEEKKHLLMAVGALTIAFTLLFAGLEGLSIFTVIGLSFVAVITGFLLHEIGHKIVAQRYGCWAEFRAWPFGLLMAVFSAFMGFLFAAPGAVYVRGHLSKEENGKVSAAGPLMNIVVASFLLPIWIFISPIDELQLLISMILWLNLFIGGFNMIPVPPLDGSKIIRWNPGIWIGMLVVLGVYFILFFDPSLILG
ncbi:MAG: site-2 protease family protein [Thermoplasmata archaeon]